MELSGSRRKRGGGVKGKGRGMERGKGGEEGREGKRVREDGEGKGKVMGNIIVGQRKEIEEGEGDLNNECKTMQFRYPCQDETKSYLTVQSINCIGYTPVVIGASVSKPHYLRFFMIYCWGERERAPHLLRFFMIYYIYYLSYVVPYTLDTVI